MNEKLIKSLVIGGLLIVTQLAFGSSVGPADTTPGFNVIPQSLVANVGTSTASSGGGSSMGLSSLFILLMISWARRCGWAPTKAV